MSQLRVNRNSEEFFKKFSSVFRFENHNWEAAGAVKLAAVSLLRVEKNSDPSPEVKFNSKQSFELFFSTVSTRYLGQFHGSDNCH
ncbi:hypothetical protein [Rhodopirellula sp. SWK7]|uniref:hypothetical protein n=1 Tax=Rhodopirellula sp. SWK7 TaxID=595460 RepID=UPI0002BE3DC3|nr:hypothetical protein [Rhodopirellula sp. SWK7]EMI42785.1 hypothetical protein RRSWK_04598 [Rhodopirellula sp. SWK7]